MLDGGFFLLRVDITDPSNRTSTRFFDELVAVLSREVASDDTAVASADDPPHLQPDDDANPGCSIQGPSPSPAWAWMLVPVYAVGRQRNRGR